jgi:predicted ATPase
MDERMDAMITRFHIENFKSLADFDLPSESHRLGMFVCLIGLNGSGKSTLLQALDFAGHVVLGKEKEWLAQREWKPTEISTNLGNKRSPVVVFRIEMQDPNGMPMSWEARYNTIQGRCTQESVKANDRTVLNLTEGRLELANSSGRLEKKFAKMDFVYQGSVLSLLQLSDADAWLKWVKDALGNLKSLELLSPQLMRRRARSAQDMGLGGEKLSAFLGTLPQVQKRRLLTELQRFYPWLANWDVKTLKAGWKSLRVEEEFAGRHTVEAAHVNDGLLRVMAILSEAYGEHSFLLFDEIENGINPELVEKLMDGLRDCRKQVVVTTHSPMILNYIPDDVARESVHLLYKTKRGETRSVRYFDLEGTNSKLRALGPGEVFADTNLTRLVSQINEETPVQTPEET